MDSTPRNAESLKKRIDTARNALITSLTDILDTATEPPENQRDPISVQGRKLRAEFATGTMVRCCEDLLVLVRGMQEKWLFGGLDTLKEGKGEGGDGELVRILRELDGMGDASAVLEDGTGDASAVLEDQMVE